MPPPHPSTPSTPSHPIEPAPIDGRRALAIGALVASAAGLLLVLVELRTRADCPPSYARLIDGTAVLAIVDASLTVGCALVVWRRWRTLLALVPIAALAASALLGGLGTLFTDSTSDCWTF